MAYEQTATLNMQRPPQAAGETQLPEQGRFLVEMLEPSRPFGMAPTVVTSFEQGEPVNVLSFRDAVLAASIFYGIREPEDLVILAASGHEGEDGPQPEELADPDPNRETIVPVHSRTGC